MYRYMYDTVRPLNDDGQNAIFCDLFATPAGREIDN